MDINITRGVVKDAHVHLMFQIHMNGANPAEKILKREEGDTYEGRRQYEVQLRATFPSKGYDHRAGIKNLQRILSPLQPSQNNIPSQRAFDQNKISERADIQTEDLKKEIEEQKQIASECEIAGGLSNEHFIHHLNKPIFTVDLESQNEKEVIYLLTFSREFNQMISENIIFYDSLSRQTEGYLDFDGRAALTLLSEGPIALGKDKKPSRELLTSLFHKNFALQLQLDSNYVKAYGKILQEYDQALLQNGFWLLVLSTQAVKLDFQIRSKEDEDKLVASAQQSWLGWLTRHYAPEKQKLIIEETLNALLSEDGKSITAKFEIKLTRLPNIE